MRLNVGLLLESMELPAWAFRMLERIHASAYARVRLVVLRKPPAPAGKKGLLNRRPWQGLGYRVVCHIDQRRRTTGPDAFAPMDASQLLRDVPVVNAVPQCGRFSDRLRDADIETIRRHKPDVLIRLGFRILRGDILKAARCGVWSFHHGDNARYRGGPPGLWEVYEDQPVTGSILQILSEDLDGGMVLARTHSATQRESVRANRNNYYWKTSLLLPRKLQELHRVGWDRFEADARRANRHPDIYSRRLYVKPTNSQSMRLLLSLAGRYVADNLSSCLFREQWALAYCLCDGLPRSLDKLRWIVPPPDRFWADPHVLCREGRYYIFIEEFLFALDKAHIALLVMDEEGRWRYEGKVLQRPYHVSYPHLFEHQGELYMLPETRCNHTIELYRCVDFPSRWEHCGNLMEGVDAVDSTLLERDGRWWLFANIAEVPGASTWDELFIFHADNPLSASWTSHLGNPVVSDVRQSRPAGSFLCHNGEIYRPFQNNSHGYGWRLGLAHVRRLDEARYEEDPVLSFDGQFAPGIRGMHTFAHAGRLTMFDVRTRRAKLGFPVRQRGLRPEDLAGQTTSTAAAPVPSQALPASRPFSF